MVDRIADIHAQEILDSRGNPTVHVQVTLKSGARGSASVPSGASTGTHEAHELRDGDKRRYRGLGVRKAIEHIHRRIAPALKGMDSADQRGLDDAMRILDGTPEKRIFGANAILGVSLANAHAAAKSSHLPLYRHLREAFALSHKGFRMPTPLMNVFNGGRHADTNLDMQEFMVIPHGFTSFARKLQAGSEIFHALGDILHEEGLDTDVGNEGGYAPEVGKTEDALQFLSKAVKRAKYRLGSQVGFGIDAASSEFFDGRTETYLLAAERKTLSASELTHMYEQWASSYPLLLLEDGLSEDAWDEWKVFTRRLGKDLLLVGDDLFVTNPDRLQRGISEGVANAVLIKPNQIGTLSETLETIELAQKHRYHVVLSHRSGETPDATISDIAVAVRAEYIKAGAPSRSERLAKYNRLLEIEEEVRVA